MRRAAGMALVAGGTLLAEVALTRVFSVSLYHHFAFLVVSTALLGSGVAGAFISSSRRVASADGDKVAALGALILALGLPVCFSLVQVLRLEPLALVNGSEALKLGLVYILMAIPFFGGGLAIAVTLDRRRDQAAFLYAADLVGAGVGAFGTLLLLSLVGGLGALLIGAAIAAVGAAFFGKGRIRLLATAVAVGLAAMSPIADAVVPLHITASKVTRGGVPFAKVLRDPARTKSTAWNSLARVDDVVFESGVERLMIDAGVAAVRVPSKTAPTASDATLPYELIPGGRVLIIGAGAGWEVQEALAFGAGHVDAVEVNALVAAFVPEVIAKDPRVSWIVDEGRSYAMRSPHTYDAIVMIHTISNAATAAGAMHLAEDYLLTEEALAYLVDRLSDRGVLFITRPEAQLPRLLASLSKSLNVYGWAERSTGASFYGALLISKAPLDPARHQQIVDRIASRRGLRMLFTPSDPPNDPLFKGILAGEPLDRLEPLAIGRLDPATDDRPFFHQRRRFTELTLDDFKSTLGIERDARMALEDQPFAEIAAVLLLIETTLVGAIALLLPFLIRRQPATSRRRFIATFVYFAALGLGFMLVEIALVQRLGLLLGAPALAFATVFAGLLIGAGIGSHVSARLPKPIFAPAMAVVVALLLALLLPAVLNAGAGSEKAIRIALALLIVLPTGFVLGMPFPSGLRLLSDTKGLVAWAFATNGITSIAGTVLALIGASIFGFTGVLVAGALSYAIAVLAGRALE